ncbi:hypothetical protein G5714_000113 [Onychostoma macrolepis]|uniref:Uncharacterized protein n=1 Tax=Onychostoma macrolepis TaxID=369639 RepID=A0A7J6DFI1_9TELE|nr:hypothetical protein G5714_000113 [Onychostoma macrolepis]
MSLRKGVWLRVGPGSSIPLKVCAWGLATLSVCHTLAVRSPLCMLKSWYRVCVVTGMLTGVGSTWMCSHQLRWLGDAITWRWNSWLCGQWLVSRDLDVATLFSSEKSWDVSQGFLLVKFQVCCSVLCLVLGGGTIMAMLFLLVGNRVDFLMKHLSQ